MHVRLADEAVPIGPPAARESYLRMDRLIEAAQKTHANAIHPGYGFLSENAEFAEAVSTAGLVFIGPPAEAIRKMGNKTRARAIMQAAHVPIVPGYHGAADADFAEAAGTLGYPVLVKAAGGGGGKGMRIVRAPGTLAEAVDSAEREAEAAFGDGSLFLERYIEDSRHIEIQVLADSFHNTVHLFERECSIQRRHQKIIEETPSPFLNAGAGLVPAQGQPQGSPLRERMGAAAVAAARAVGYVNAGTIEFIVDADENFYFLEMNTRLQVEHPITEAVTGIDLAQAQIRIAAGERLWFGQGDVSQRGHAIECRVYAEDASNEFMPSVGRLVAAVEPSRPGVRVDSGVAAGDEVSIFYDPMIAKVIAHGETREAAIRKMRAALADYTLTGVTTNIPFLQAVLAHPAFERGETTTDFIERNLRDWKETEVGGQRSEVREQWTENGEPWDRTDGFRLGMEPVASDQSAVGGRQQAVRRATKRAGNADTLSAAMPAQVRGVLVAEGDAVDRGQTLVLLEAMKMEIRVAAPHAGKVKRVLVTVGDVVERGQKLVELGH
jgi:acetyl/propionyl-CoA carboxylase alpha subunit